jgi:hypothetical protein
VGDVPNCWRQDVRIVRQLVRLGAHAGVMVGPAQNGDRGAQNRRVRRALNRRSASKRTRVRHSRCDGKMHVVPGAVPLQQQPSQEQAGGVSSCAAGARSGCSVGPSSESTACLGSP